MKITIVGSSQYRDKILKLAEELRREGHEVRVPAFDDHPEFDELQVCKYNRESIEWADEVHLFWDNRSPGAVFDMGMVFALRKPLVIEYIESKTFEGVFRKYEKECHGLAEQVRRGC